MINKIELYDLIKEAAETYLSDLQDMYQNELCDNLKYFAEKAQDIAQRIMEKYVINESHRYTEGFNKILDVDKLRAFVDFKTGYVQQMFDWIKTNAPVVQEINFNIESEACNPDIPFDASPKVILGVGTAIAVGIFIFSNIWIALAAEIIAICASAWQKKRLSISQSQKEMQARIMNQKIESKKNELVHGVCSDLDKWLEKGVQESDAILKLFGVK